MAAFVLVHGAWSGAHGFHLVRRRLWAAGHEAFTPSLTGVGERVHLTGPGVTLSTHVADVVNSVLYEDLDGIVLVGFSYGGAVVTAALPHIADRVAHLVYLDAFVPDDGDTVGQLAGGPPPGPITLGAPWLVPPTPRTYDDPLEAAFSEPRRVDHPAACFTEPIRVPGRSRTTRSRAPTCGPPPTHPTHRVRRPSTPPRPMPGRRRPGDATTSPRTTWSPRTARTSWWPSCSTWSTATGRSSRRSPGGPGWI